MRLICPKCEAQYNVADDAIPKGGRDVQCSTCGHTWFQTEMSRVLSRPVSRLLPNPLPETVKSEVAEPRLSKSRDVAAFDVPHHHKDKTGTHEPKHRPVDPTIASILRDEAAREHNVPARAATAEAPRKPANPVDIEETRKRIAQMTGTEGATRPQSSTSGATAAAVAAPAAAGMAKPAPNPRSVPSIDEINNVMRGRAADGGGGLTEAERNEAMRRRGFRRGFFVVLALFGLIVTPYVLADQIMENLPQSRETMVQYVAVIDELRDALNAFVGGIRESLQTMMG